jgi:GDP/UDP-N,N'-diacetylbacillosamine 2-epimerase (hydrolysing)
MSHLHFVATETYKQRVIQLGEDPDNIFNFGSPGLDNIHNLKLLSKEKFEKSIDFKLGRKNLLVTFHPVTLERSTAKEQFQQLLNALDELSDTHIIFTKANADTDGRLINMMIDGYVLANLNKSIAFASLGQLRYLSALKYIDAVVGNSSSGLIEAPSFKIGTINIGDRQKGRIKADCVIDCEPDKDQIKSAISQLYTAEFQQVLRCVSNPYGSGGASKKIASVLSVQALANLLKKKFIDLPFPKK